MSLKRRVKCSLNIQNIMCLSSKSKFDMMTKVRTQKYPNTKTFV